MIRGEKSRTTAEVRKSRDGQKERERAREGEYEEEHREGGEERQKALECNSI